MSHVTHQHPPSNIPRHTSYGIRHTSHVTRHMSHVTRHTSRACVDQVSILFALHRVWTHAQKTVLALRACHVRCACVVCQGEPPHVIDGTSQVSRQMSHVRRHTSHVKRHLHDDADTRLQVIGRKRWDTNSQIHVPASPSHI